MSSDTSIKVSAELLRTLHRIQRQRTDLKSQLERGPRQIQASAAMVAELEATVGESQEKLRKAKMAADEKQLQLKSREDRVQQLRIKLNSAASNREYTALKEQIAADEQANEVLSDEILEAYERIDGLEAERTELQEQLKRRQEEHAEFVSTVDETMKQKSESLARVEAELAEAEDQLPPPIRLEYDRIVGTRGEEALAPVEGETCGGCYQMLTSQMMNRLYLGQAVRCPACGAMMYLPEDRTVR
ncbi:zinc ribbon domain-containing protein [Candidatus Laterigemmans baculatus]|uniref:zinc ribbon domain-containing protein n=1 Tax=Candidatus Laterigemmans baculatus TaxID=2770505 RepID=UPI0013D8EF0F|nr:phospholipase [Candidatus Laterigemmans baculatus]